MKLLLVCLSLLGSVSDAALMTRVKVGGKILSLTSTTIELEGSKGGRFVVPRPKDSASDKLRPGQTIAVSIELADLKRANQGR